MKDVTMPALPPPQAPAHGVRGTAPLTAPPEGAHAPEAPAAAPPAEHGGHLDGRIETLLSMADTAATMSSVLPLPPEVQAIGVNFHTIEASVRSVAAGNPDDTALQATGAVLRSAGMSETQARPLLDIAGTLLRGETVSPAQVRGIVANARAQGLVIDQQFEGALAHLSTEPPTVTAQDVQLVMSGLRMMGVTLTDAQAQQVATAINREGGVDLDHVMMVLRDQPGIIGTAAAALDTVGQIPVIGGPLAVVTTAVTGAIAFAQSPQGHEMLNQAEHAIRAESAAVLHNAGNSVETASQAVEQGTEGAATHAEQAVDSAGNWVAQHTSGTVLEGAGQVVRDGLHTASGLVHDAVAAVGHAVSGALHSISNGLHGAAANVDHVSPTPPSGSASGAAAPGAAPAAAPPPAPAAAPPAAPPAAA